MNEEPYKICLRLNADEAQKLITNAKACGLTRTAYLRRLLNGYDLKPRPSAELEALRTEIHQIGNNINQIARKANAGFASREETTRALRMLDAMLSKGQEDENGILFVCFPVTAIAAVLSRSSMTVKRSLNELETAGLIMRVRQGIGEPNRIYVLIPGKEDAALA